VSRIVRGARRAWWCVAVFSFTATDAAQAQGHVAAINGESLYYEVTGEGPPLVLIHGWSLNLRMWDPQISELRQHFRVIRFDRRGFGRSGGSEDGTWDAADLNALLDHLGEGEVHVLGMSSGARSALQLARHYPERVLSLILHGSSPPGGFGLPWTGADRPRFDEWATVARGEGMAAFRQIWAAHPLMAIPAERTQARAHLAELLAAYRGGRLLSQVRPSGPDAAISMDDLPELAVPTLVLIGDSEVPFLQIVSRALAYYIRNAQLVVVPGGGHLVNLVEPERYNLVVLTFLSNMERARGEQGLATFTGMKRR